MTRYIGITADPSDPSAIAIARGAVHPRQERKVAVLVVIGGTLVGIALNQRMPNNPRGQAVKSPRTAEKNQIGAGGIMDKAMALLGCESMQLDKQTR
jgi:hypothetical protein